MRTLLKIALTLLLMGAAFSQVVDRMVAVVNKRVILESELDQATRVEFLMQGKPLEKLTPADKLAVLDRLIDRSLLDQQIVNGDMLAPDPAELAARIKDIRDQIPGAATDEGWKKILESYGLMQQDVEDNLIAQFRILRFVDLRFRGLVRVDKNQIETYYREKFLPQLQKQGVAEPPLAQVSGRIEKVLVEQSIDEMLTRWLETLRAQAHIEKMNVPGGAANGATP
ncbi:MAG TPA: SurA N-terminal domain-containing protein [Candidatus Limnocylindrales bacterium]|nr:SurA N-terminal domain-containing protein [Candidatus Limnocylindrales bacterium]